MFKKLQNLLFEDEDEDIENEPAQTAAPKAQTAPAQPVKPVVQPQQVVRPVEPAQKAPAAAPVMPQAPVQPVVVKAPAEPVQKAEEKKTLGLTVDDPLVEKKKTVKPVSAKPAAPAVKKSEDTSATYQFRPVISPIFGVNEKDVTALKNTTNKLNKVKQLKKDQNVTPVLSPMYGVSVDEPAAEKDIDETTVESVPEKSAAVKEDDVPEFSLDDILKVRDEEFAEEDREVKEDDGPAFPDLTFSDEDAPEVVDDEDVPADVPADLPADEPIDNTVVIKQQLFDDDEN